MRGAEAPGPIETVRGPAILRSRGKRTENKEE